MANSVLRLTMGRGEYGRGVTEMKKKITKRNAIWKNEHNS